MKSEFNTLWQKYGTFGILIIVMVVFGISQPVLFFSFDLNSCEHLHKESIKNIAEYDKIYIEFLYVDFATSFDIDKIYVRTMPVKHTTDLALPNFDVFSYIDNWEKSMMFVDRNTKVIYEHSP